MGNLSQRWFVGPHGLQWSELFDKIFILLSSGKYITFCMYNAFKQRLYARSYPGGEWPVLISYNSSTTSNF